MDKQLSEFYIEIKKNVVTSIGRSIIEQPPINFNEKGIVWYEDKKKGEDDKTA